MMIESLYKKINPENIALLKENELYSIGVLRKLLEWQDEYDHIEWEDFKENYFKCSRCNSYDNQHCICYAR